MKNRNVNIIILISFTLYSETSVSSVDSFYFLFFFFSRKKVRSCYITDSICNIHVTRVYFSSALLKETFCTNKTDIKFTKIIFKKRLFSVGVANYHFSSTLNEWRPKAADAAFTGTPFYHL